MAVRERGRRDPALERLLVAPARDDQPLETTVGRPEELEALEAVLTVDRARACGEPLGQLVAGVLGNRDGIDLDDGRHEMLPCSETGETIPNGFGGASLDHRFALDRISLVN